MTEEKSIDCHDFRDALFHFQADEVPESLRRTLQHHLDVCAPCASRLEVENAFLAFFRKRLRRRPAPAELRARVRRALEREAPDSAPGLLAWLRAPAAAVLAGAGVLALALGAAAVRAPGDFSTPHARVVRVARAATVVDLQCDQAGRTIEQQRRCRNHAHVNALRVARGTYWNFSLDQSVARRILFDPDWRGRRAFVRGDFYPALSTLHLDSIDEPAPIAL